VHDILFPYYSPASLFRIYREEECDPDGYPFIWPAISEQRCKEANSECGDCALYYRDERDSLTVHHCNMRKEDCRRQNLEVLCWPCHSMNHCDDRMYRSVRCPHCKKKKVEWWFLGGAHLMRHIKGRHRSAGPEEERPREYEPEEEQDREVRHVERRPSTEAERRAV
jgi:hypothetical protein